MHDFKHIARLSLALEFGLQLGYIPSFELFILSNYEIMPSFSFQLPGKIYLLTLYFMINTFLSDSGTH